MHTSTPQSSTKCINRRPGARGHYYSYHSDWLLASPRIVMEKKMIRFPSLPQLAKIASLLLLFLLVPFVPPSLRAPYLYLLFNALVVALGVQAGFISVSGPRDERKLPPSSTPGTAASPNLTKQTEAAAASTGAVTYANHLGSGGTVAPPLPTKAPLLELREVKLADHAAIKDVVGAAKKLKKKIKKCPSRASIFFIGSVDADDGEVVDATVQEEGEEEEKVWKDAGELMSKQELYTKAEAFIGNFYKQLKMQREESWNKLHDLYNYHHHYKTKAF